MCPHWKLGPRWWQMNTGDGESDCRPVTLRSPEPLKIGLNPGAKLVLLALCDNASDEGACFPSIRTLAAKCCMAERTVQGHISAFEADGLLTRVERPGRSTVYTLNPRSFCTPAEFAPHPRKNCTPTPAVSAPHPRSFCTHNHQGTIRGTIR